MIFTNLLNLAACWELDKPVLPPLREDNFSYSLESGGLFLLPLYQERTRPGVLPSEKLTPPSPLLFRTWSFT